MDVALCILVAFRATRLEEEMRLPANRIVRMLCCRHRRCCPSDLSMDLLGPIQQHKGRVPAALGRNRVLFYPSIHAVSTTASVLDDNELTRSSHIFHSSPFDSALSSVLSYISSTLPSTPPTPMHCYLSCRRCRRKSTELSEPETIRRGLLWNEETGRQGRQETRL